MQGNSVEVPVEQVVVPLSDKIAIANCILTAILLLVTAISVYCAFRAYKNAVRDFTHQKERAKKDAACELAKYYAQHIIDEFQFVLDVLVLSKLNERIEQLFPYDDISDLDRKELDKLLQRAETTFEAVEKEMTLISPLAIYSAKILTAKTISERHLIAEEYLVRKKQEDGEVPMIGIAHESLLQNEFSGKITTLLNNLEHFAMSCRYGLADEEMLYQSLHQTYISQVRLLYFYICRNNTTNEDKVYTNLIWLFNLWKDRLKKIQKTKLAQRAEADERIVALEAQLREVREEAEHIEPEVYTGSALK